MTFSRTFFLTLLAITILAVAFVAGYMVRDFQDYSTRFPIFDQVYRILVKNGLPELPPDPALEYGMIRGLLQAYNDPYTQFVEPARHELDSNALEGSFGGIGVRFAPDGSGHWLVYPFPDSPASQAGVQEGDRLLTIDDLKIQPDTSFDVIQAAIRGPVGKSLTLGVGRPPDFSPILIRIKRANIPVPSVTWHLDSDSPNVGVLEVNLIAASTVEELQKAVEDLQTRGAERFVLDLRNNPGGLLTAGIEVARLFLKDGVVIEQQYRGREVEVFQVEQAGPLANIPLNILINHGSASAAEVIAGALQAGGRAKLVGSPSYGKDTIQLVFDLSDGSSLHVTAARWWIPGAPSWPEGQGLQPDIPVAPPPENSPPAGADTVLQTAIQNLMETK